MLNIRFAKDYLLHRLTAKSRHGTHSPFVYRLVDTVIYDFSDKKVYTEIENISRQAKADRKITSTISPKRTQLLYRLVADLQPQNIIEAGTVGGMTNLYLQKATPQAKVISVTAPPQIDDLIELDFAFFNTAMQNEALKYFEHCLPKVKNHTMLIFNDIYRTKRTWASIKAHPQVTVTIDLFYMGLVFFRKGQEKEDFKIKIEPGFFGF
jgi:hypothetical protein